METHTSTVVLHLNVDVIFISATKVKGVGTLAEWILEKQENGMKKDEISSRHAIIHSIRQKSGGFL